MKHCVIHKIDFIHVQYYISLSILVPISCVQGLAGVFASLALIITIAVTSNDLQRTALGYFLTGLIVVIICLLALYPLLCLVGRLVPQSVQAC